jgi:DNA repair exonuclease SbcCD ATPase subunit
LQLKSSSTLRSQHESLVLAEAERKDKIAGILMARVGTAEEKLQTALRREREVASRLENELAALRADRDSLKESLHRANSSEQRFRSLVSLKDKEIEEKAALIIELRASLTTAEHKLQFDYVPRSLHDATELQLGQLRKHTDTETVPLDLHRRVATELDDLRREVSERYVKSDIFEELKSKFESMYAFLRDETVTVGAFTDVVLKYDELEASISRSYVTLEAYEALSAKYTSSREEFARIQDNISSLEKLNTDAISRIAYSDDRCAEAEDKLDRCRAEIKNLYQRIDESERMRRETEGELQNYNRLYEETAKRLSQTEAERARLMVQLGDCKAAIAGSRSAGSTPLKSPISPTAAFVPASHSTEAMRIQIDKLNSKCEHLQHRKKHWKTIATALITQQVGATFSTPSRKLGDKDVFETPG